MSAFSNYMENLILNVFLRANPDDFSPSPAVYLALYTSNPDEDNSGTEVSSTNTAYVRQLVTLSSPTDGVASNTNVLTFPIATSSWGTITHIGLMDEQTEGNLLYYGAVTPSNTVAVGGRMEFPVGSVQVSSSGSFGTYFANAIIDCFLRGNPDSIEPLASTYLALYTANPTAADAGVEVEGASYARQPLIFGEPGDGVVANTQAITYASGSKRCSAGSREPACARRAIRGTACVGWMFTLTASAYNLIRLPKLLATA